jgi:hypothetical protein
MSNKQEKKEISWLKSNAGTMTIYADGKVYNIKSDHRNYNEIVVALKKSDAAEIKRLADMGEYLSSYSTGSVKVDNGVITYNGVAVHNGITKRIFELQKGGFPFGFMAKFLDNMMRNPSYRATVELYDFLAHQSLPITDDGCFLAYKSVRTDWLDHHSGTYDNHVGKIVEMPRNGVDDERRNACSNGLHVGTINYVKGFTAGNIIICKVNPADVVSVPTDHSCEKLRTCKYEVLEVYTGDLTSPVYTTAGGVAPAVANQVKEATAAATASLLEKTAAPSYSAPTSAAPHPNDEDDEDEDDEDEDEDEEEDALTPDQIAILKAKGFDTDTMDAEDLADLVEQNPKLLEKNDATRKA